MLNLKNQTLLVIAPHPDDEVIGCGGMILRIKDEGGKVFVLFLTVGDTKDFSKEGKSSLTERRREVEKVAEFLKFDNYHIAFAGNKYHLKLDLLGQHVFMNMIEQESKVSIEKVKPTIVAFPSLSYNQDHRIAAVAAHASLRPAAGDTKHFVETVLSYESPADEWRLGKNSSINFLLPLSGQQMNAKLHALKLYQSQMRKQPNPRSLKVVESLGTLRGSQCGSLYAEGFTAYRVSC